MKEEYKDFIGIYDESVPIDLCEEFVNNYEEAKKNQTIINVSRYIEFDIKNEIFSHYQTLDQNFYIKNRTGDLMNRISEDVSRARMYFGPVLMYGTNAIVLFIVIISYMFSIEPKLTIYTLIPLPVLSIIIYKILYAIIR